MSIDDYNDALPIPRRRIFVLNDGQFVVQWEEHRVQSLNNGRYYSYDEANYGAPISDYELNQLMHSGRVSDYDDKLVYLSLQPMDPAKQSTRAYYLNTRLPKTKLALVTDALDDAGVAGHYSVRMQEIFVIIRDAKGLPFRNFDDAERAREELANCCPDVLDKLVVAFIEIVSAN